MFFHHWWDHLGLEVDSLPSPKNDHNNSIGLTNNPLFLSNFQQWLIQKTSITGLLLAPPSPNSCWSPACRYYPWAPRDKTTFPCRFSMFFVSSCVNTNSCVNRLSRTSFPENVVIWEEVPRSTLKLLNGVDLPCKNQTWMVGRSFSTNL